VSVADNYLQFSEVIANLTEQEEAWLKDQLQSVRVFGEKEYPEDAVPTELADTDADWSGVRFLHDKPDQDSQWDALGFEYSFHDDRGNGGHATDSWGRHLWLYTEGWGDATNVAWLVQKFLKTFRPDECWSLTYATTCSKPRVGQFGGGAVFVTADTICCQNAYDFVEGQRASFRRKEAVHVSVWDDTISCRSACRFDPATLHVSDIETATNQEDAESCGALTDEYVEVDDKQLRESDGIVFEYKEDSP
jgi:hypothetical protein